MQAKLLSTTKVFCLNHLCIWFYKSAATPLFVVFVVLVMSSFSSCLMQMTYVFSHSILFKRWVGGFRVFYDAMFEICPPSHTLFFLCFPMKCHGFFLPECRFPSHPYSIPPNEDGRKAPTLLRKKN